MSSLYAGVERLGASGAGRSADDEEADTGAEEEEGDPTIRWGRARAGSKSKPLDESREYCCLTLSLILTGGVIARELHRRFS